MNRTFLAGTALFTALSMPVLAEAASGFATANVNVRSGPSTAYPAVTLIPVGQTLRINGCLAETPWCDVSFPGGRGWVAGRYIQATYQQRRIYVGPEYYRPLGIPTVVFNLDSYWDRNYRGRDFYRDRDRWSRGPDWDRNGDQNWGRRRPPPPPPPSVYDEQDDNYQGNWRRQPGYGRQGYDNDYSQDGDNRPPPPRYRQPYGDNRQYGNPPPPPPGNFQGGNFQGGSPQRPPRQQDQGQARPQPPAQAQPAPQAPPPPPAPAQQQGGRQPQPGPPVICTNGGGDCPPGSIHSSHN